jgi:hypothetical protein
LEEALAQISIELLEPVDEKLFTVTDVTPSEIFIFPTLDLWGKRFKSDNIPLFEKNFLLLRISRLRMGRKEFVMMGSGLKDMGEDKKRRLGAKEFFGRM